MAATEEELTSWRQNMSKCKMPTLARLGQDEVALIWSHVSDFVLRQMLQQKGVHIPAFGTFTFMRHKLDVGNKFILTQKPLFLMAEKLLQLHGLSQNKVYTPGDIPIVPLNFVTISMAGPYNRDTVERCIKETLQLLSRSICTKKKIEFIFQRIGVLTIQKEKVKMKFFKEFQSAMDKSGNPKKDSTNRLRTLDSRKCPDTVLVFPRIDLNLKGKHPTVETLEEMAPPQPRKSLLTVKPDTQDKPDKPEVIKVNFIPRPPGEKPVPVPPSVVPFTLPVKMEQDKTAKGTSPKSVPSVTASKKEPEAKPKTSETPTCKDHVRAGQEMCYACMQRAQGNIPVSCRQEQKCRDIEDDLNLQSYQLMKDREALFKHQLRMKAEWEQNMRNAANNLGVAVGMKVHKNQKCQFQVGSRGLNGPFRLPTKVSLPASANVGKDEYIKMGERWEHNVQLRKMQVEAAENQKKTVILQQIKSQTRDILLLQRSNELVADELFILDQCKDYKRCMQCQRDPSNKGKTNFWPCNKHLPGSHEHK